MLLYCISMAVLVSTLLYATRTKKRWLEWVVKPLAALTFIGAGVASGATSTTWGTIMLVGLVLAAGGDVLLIPKGNRAFLAGLTSFLLGHVAYAVAFGVRGLDPTWTAVGAAIVVVIAVPVLRWLWPNVKGPMRGPVAAYIVVITTMVALAAGTVGAHGDPRILIGAFGFYLSDLAVARDKFVAPGFVNRAWGLPLYFFAQLLLATTVAGPT